MDAKLEAACSIIAVTAIGWGVGASVGTPWPAWVAVGAGAGLAWFRINPRAYGLILVGVPGAFGLLVTPGGLTARALGGLALMVGYWSAWSALQSREDESRFGWWPAIILAAWQPTVWAVPGIAFLAASSSRAWRGGLAPARGALRPLGPSWASWSSVAVGVLAVALMAWPLPQPGGFQLQDATIVVPRFEVPTSSATPPPFFSSGASGFRLAFPSLPAWWWFGLGIACAVWLGRRSQGAVGAWRAGKITKRRLVFDLSLPLVALTTLLMAFVIAGLPGSIGQVRAVNLPVPFGPIFGVLYALGLLGLAWRAWTFLRGLLDRVGWRAMEPIRLPPRPATTLELPADRVRAAYARWLAHLRDLDWPRAVWETPHEFARRVSVHHDALREHTRAITEAYERVRYGGAPSDLEARAVEDAVKRWLEVVPEASTPDVTDAAIA